MTHSVVIFFPVTQSNIFIIKTFLIKAETATFQETPNMSGRFFGEGNS